MERKMILASHGRMASGTLESIELITGENKNISALDCYVEDNFDLSRSVKDLLIKYERDELIVITDLFGGSVNNEFLQYMETANLYLIAGINLSLLIELATQFEAVDDIKSLIRNSLLKSKETIQFCNETVLMKVEEEDF